MLANIHMFELGDKRWQVLGEQPDSLLVIAIDNQFVIESEPNVFKQTIPLKSLYCCMRQGEQFDFSY